MKVRDSLGLGWERDGGKEAGYERDLKITSYKCSAFGRIRSSYEHVTVLRMRIACVRDLRWLSCSKTLIRNSVNTHDDNRLHLRSAACLSARRLHQLATLFAARRM